MVGDVFEMGRTMKDCATTAQHAMRKLARRRMVDDKMGCGKTDICRCMCVEKNEGCGGGFDVHITEGEGWVRALLMECIGIMD